MGELGILVFVLAVLALVMVVDGLVAFFGNVFDFGAIGMTQTNVRQAKIWASKSFDAKQPGKKYHFMFMTHHVSKMPSKQSMC